MTVLNGSGGYVVFSNGSIVDGIKTWSLDAASAHLNASDFTKSWVDTDGGVKEWSGSFEGNFDDTDPQQTTLWDNLIGGGKGFLMLGMSASHQFMGTVVMTSHGPSHSFDSLGAATWNFKGHGPLVITAALNFVISGSGGNRVTNKGEVTWQS